MKADLATVRSLLRAPFASTRPVERLGAAVWLYLFVVCSANDRGMLIRTRSRLARELGVGEPDIDRWVRRLLQAKLIRLLSPSPYLAMRLRMWPRSPVVEAAEQGDRQGRERNARVSSKQQAADSNKQGDGSTREGGPSHDEIREALGDPDLDVAALVSGAPVHAVRRALHRVRRTPSAKIRKSKAALFRYLLTKLTHEIDVQDL